MLTCRGFLKILTGSGNAVKGSTGCFSHEPSPYIRSERYPRRRVPDRTPASRSAGAETQGCGSDCTGKARGTGDGGLIAKIIG